MKFKSKLVSIKLNQWIEPFFELKNICQRKLSHVLVGIVRMDHQLSPLDSYKSDCD